MQPLTSQQKQIVLALSVVVALTRWWGLSSSLWDWDEALFSMGVRSFDVTSHHPHPPGFPLYILFGKVLNLFFHNEFRSLQAINFVGAVLLFPSIFFLAHQIGFTFATAIGGALITVFAPNIWFFGGTAFSDVPSLTLVVGASAVLLASRQQEGARAASPAGPRAARALCTFIVGCTLLAISAGFRPQNLAIGLVPFLLAAWPRLRTRQWGAVMIGAVIIGAIVVASYIGAGLASLSWRDYQSSLKAHREYIVKVDSFRNAVRPPLRKLFDDFFIREFQFRRVSVGIFVLAVISLAHAVARFRKPPLILLVSFGPFALSAWLVLDFISVSRFSIGYLPLFAILGADGIHVLTKLVRIPERWQEAVVGAGGAAVALAMAIWAAPAITEAHRTISPPAAAVRWIRQNLSATTKLYVDQGLIPVAEYLLSDYQMTRVLDERAVPLRPGEDANAYVLAEGATAEPSGLNFLRSRNSRLWRIARRRYFEVSIIPLARRAQFLDGWYGAENEGAETWRWMGRRSVTILPPQPPPAELRLSVGAPIDVVPVPTITIRLNGEVVDRFRGAEWNNSRTYVIRNSHANSPNELVIETDQWINPQERGISGDPRELGLVLRDMSWGPDRSGRERTAAR